MRLGSGLFSTVAVLLCTFLVCLDWALHHCPGLSHCIFIFFSVEHFFLLTIFNSFCTNLTHYFCQGHGIPVSRPIAKALSLHPLDQSFHLSAANWVLRDHKLGLALRTTQRSRCARSHMGSFVGHFAWLAQSAFALCADVNRFRRKVVAYHTLKLISRCLICSRRLNDGKGFHKALNFFHFFLQPLQIWIGVVTPVCLPCSNSGLLRLSKLL